MSFRLNKPARWYLLLLYPALFTVRLLGIVSDPIMKPLAIDLYCGLGGWAEGFLSEGYNIIGFDIQRHDYGTGGYPGQLVLQDVLTLHGAQFRNATTIVASPPCQAYSYRAMPWKRAKALPPPDNSLFDACFRIQREASEAAGHHIPLVLENVKGAQRWVGRAAWHYGSYYFWGDVPALMPIAQARSLQSPAVEHTKNNGGSWFGVAHNTKSGIRQNPVIRRRRAASAHIAKIPFPVSQWIARVFKPVQESGKPSSRTAGMLVQTQKEDIV